MATPNINAALYTVLSQDSAVAAIVGAKIYHLKNEAESATPYLVYYNVSGLLRNVNPSQLHSYVYSVDCWETTAKAARTLASAVFVALHDATLTIAGHTNYWTFVENERAFPETENNIEYYRYVIDVRIKTTNS